MDERPTVVLFGDSLLMDTVENNLLESRLLGVVRIHTNVTDVEDRLKALRPDLVIFELDTPHSRFVLPFLRDQSGIPLLGLDLICSRVVALSSQQYRTLSMQDLSQVIQIETAHRVRESEPSDEALSEPR
jgi:hypothetical protein